MTTPTGKDAAARFDLSALLVAGAFFMENLDGTVIVTALPQMALSFGIPVVDLNIGVSAYLLTLAVLIPISGWIADRFGARRVFASGVVVFTVASLLCGISPGLASFTAARILQGVGGAIMVPVGRLLILRTTAKPDLMRAIATITWPGLAAPLLGPPLGGFLATHASWRWIFFINLPLGLLALGLVFVVLPKGGPQHDRPFDVVGFLLTGLACFGLLYSLDLVGRDEDSAFVALSCLAGSFVVGTLAVLHAARHRAPLVAFDALRIRSFAVSVYGGSLFRSAIGAVPFLLPLLFQVAFGYDAFTAGLLVLAVFAGNIVMKPFTTTVLRRWSFRQVLLVNGLVGSATIFGCALLTPSTPLVFTLLLLFVGGLCRSMQFTALNTLAFADVPDGSMSGANTLFNMAQQMAMGLGVSLGAVALRLPGLVGDGAATHLGIADFRVAFVIMGLLALVGLIDALSLAADAGASVRAKGMLARPSAPKPPPP